MLAGLRIHRRNFGLDSLAKCLRVDASELPKCFNREEDGEGLEMLDVVYEFDQFQQVISKYGSFFNDDEKEGNGSEKKKGGWEGGEETRKLVDAGRSR